MATANEIDFSENELIELSFLRDLEADQLIAENFLDKDRQLESPLDEELVLEYEELALHVTAGRGYPALSVSYYWVDNISLPRTSIIELREQLKQLVHEANLINNHSRWEEREETGFYEPSMVVLDLAKTTRNHLEEFRKKTRPEVKDRKPQLAFAMKKASTVASSSGGKAFQYLQRTTEQICAEVPSAFRVLHVEQVLRGNLAQAFYNRQEELRRELDRQSLRTLRRHVPAQLQRSQRREDLVEHLARPRLTFHGTQRQFVPSIVRHGFLAPGARNPGTAAAHEVRCGSTYGRGIYSSPSAEFALSYSDWSCHATRPDQYFGLKLIVCATLMGRARQMFREDNWRDQGRPYEGADSHVANRELEYIVFDTAQIIPIYVIHLDWGEDNESHFVRLPTNPTQWVKPAAKKADPNVLQNERSPDEIQRAKQAMHARAAKWFPYGYGPATGGRFVVEEVGEVDEDDEEYGDYQALRGEEVKDKSSLDFWTWVKAAEEEDADHGLTVDEYRHDVRGYGPSFWDNIPEPARLREGTDDEDSDTDGGFCLEQLLTDIGDAQHVA
ncbi:hypothetical protein JX266_011758 [Neoarthrinium moseri]|nr:hypothetical protein JX266_011758 [Neoarthrinium moseri]